MCVYICLHAMLLTQYFVGLKYMREIRPYRGDIFDTEIKL